jgi:AcrR family transcriptional regulator
MTTAPRRPSRPRRVADPDRSSASHALRPGGRDPDSPSPQPYHHGALREALLVAAEAILDEGGVEAFTLRECARRAGVSHAAPAHHFGDARGLLSACAAGGFARLAAQMTAYVDAAGTDPRARLQAVGRAYIDFALAHRALFQLMFRRDRLADTHPELEQTGPQAFDLLRQALADVMAVHGVPMAEMPHRSLFAWALVHGYATLVLEGQCAGHWGLGVETPGPASAMGAELLALAGPALVLPRPD